MSWISRTVLTISLSALPLFLYIGLRLASSFVSVEKASRRKSRLVAGGVIIWLCLFPLRVWAETATGMTRNRFELVAGGPIVQYLVVYPYWVALIAAVELVGLFIILDVVTLAMRLWPSRRERWRRRLSVARIALAAAGILFVSVKMFADTGIVRDDVETVSVPNLPRELEGLRVTLVADLAVDRYTGAKKIDQMQRIVDLRSPALLTFAGDIVTGGKEYIREAIAGLCDRHGSVGSIAVMGDHDFWADPDSIVDGLRENGWDFLNNQHRVLEYNGKRILITGLTYIYSRRLDESRLDSILSSAPQADLKILLVHQPAQWLVETAAKFGYNLLLAGHTHGGQIVLHPLGITFTPSMRETRFYSGKYQCDGMAVVVTNGIGMTLAPVRYCAPAEVTTVVLERGLK